MSAAMPRLAPSISLPGVAGGQRAGTAFAVLGVMEASLCPSRSAVVKGPPKSTKQRLRGEAWLLGAAAAAAALLSPWGFSGGASRGASPSARAQELPALTSLPDVI